MCVKNIMNRLRICTKYVINFYTQIISFGVVLHHGVLFCGHLPTRNAVHYRDIYPVLIVKRQRESVYKTRSRSCFNVKVQISVPKEKS